jgi:hypothetical protein
MSVALGMQYCAQLPGDLQIYTLQGGKLPLVKIHIDKY